MKASTLYKNLLKEHNNKKKYPTLGGRSSFFVVSKKNELVIINSSNKEYFVDQALLEKVFQRYHNADQVQKKTTSHFTLNKWLACPAKITSPYIASIIYHQIKNKK